MRFKKKFDVKLTEIHQIHLTVEADDKKSAIEAAKEKYMNGECEFDENSFIAAEFEVDDCK